VTTFVDTSALLPQLSTSDEAHDRAVETFASVIRRDRLLTHSYVILETTALTQARLGLEATRALLRDIFPLLEIRWVDAALHEAAATALLAAGRRETSLVDWMSFEVMHREGIDIAFAFDRDFARQGFKLIP
jgi:predicted nucleic acid-binding protein